MKQRGLGKGLITSMSKRRVRPPKEKIEKPETIFRVTDLSKKEPKKKWRSTLLKKGAKAKKKWKLEMNWTVWGRAKNHAGHTQPGRKVQLIRKGQPGRVKVQQEEQEKCLGFWVCGGGKRRTK